MLHSVWIQFGAVVVLLCAALAATHANREVPSLEDLPDPLAVDASNPFIYINDQSTDNYNAELALAMAARGTIDLRGFLVAYPREPWKNQEEYERHRQEYVTHHREVRSKAEQSGFANLPPAQFGVFEHLMKPPSGMIEDTEPVGSAGTDLIVAQARRASREKPLVIAAGGDLCTIADAYLTDPSIAPSVVVYWHEQIDHINEQEGYNLNNSGWSAYIVLSRLATVLDDHRGSPRIEEDHVRDRIPNPLRDYMLTKEHWRYGNPLSDGVKHEGDAKALILAAFPRTRAEICFLHVSGLQESKWFDGEKILPVVAHSSSPTHLAVVSKITGATEVWWQAWGLVP